MAEMSRESDGEVKVENRSRALGKEKKLADEFKGRRDGKGKGNRRYVQQLLFGGGKKESTLGGEGELGGTSWY